MKPPLSLTNPEIRPQVVIFTACLCILVGTFMLSSPMAKTGRISIGSLSLPGVCIFKNLTGLPCPGCGLTRSMTAAIHGNISQSWMFHRLGLVTTLYILLQFLLSVIILTVSRWRGRLQKIGRNFNRGLIILAALFFVNWVVNLAALL